VGKETSAFSNSKQRALQNEYPIFPIHDPKQGQEWIRDDGERGMGEEPGGAAAKMHWMRILIGGFLAEAVLILLVIPVVMKWGQLPLLYLAPAGSLVLCFLFGFWVGPGVRRHHTKRKFMYVCERPLHVPDGCSDPSERRVSNKQSAEPVMELTN